MTQRPGQRPIAAMLSPLKDRLSLHTPGHRGWLPDGTAAPFDTTELPVTDDLYAPTGGIAGAQALMARSAGAAASVFLYGGSTAGVQSMMLAYLHPGEKVILPRNVHYSAISACVLGGFDAAFVPAQSDGMGGTILSADQYIQTILNHPDAKVVLITRPDYYGGLIDLKTIADVAHRCGMKVLADEAHGAHFNWLTDIQNAGALGADAWVQSMHKTLPALNAAAVMHFMDAADAMEAQRHMRLVQTSSPSFSVLKSIDDARDFMDRCGSARLNKLISLVNAFCEKAEALGFTDLRQQDKTRLVLFAPMGGENLANRLKDAGIDVEMYDRLRIVCVLSVMDTQTTFQRLYDALLSAANDLQTDLAAAQDLPLPPIPQKSMSIRQAYFSQSEWVCPQKAVGRTAAQSFGIYPPGIPLAVPGERINPEMMALLNQGGMSTFGLHAGKILCVKENG